MRHKKNESMLRNLGILAAVIAITFFLTFWKENRSLHHANFSIIRDQDNTQNKAPDFTFWDTKNVRRSLSDFEGQRVILNFWASWCAPCVKEMPLLTQAAKEFEDVALIALSSDLNEKNMMTFLNRYNHNTDGDVFFAYDANMAITQDLYGTFRLPETYLIDAQGNIQKKIIGADWDYEDLVAMLKDVENSAPPGE